MQIHQFIFGYLLPSQFLKTPSLPTTSFEGQTIIVTGANTGLGYEAVKHLIRLKASKIIIAVRTIKRGEAARERLVAETNCDPNRLEVWQFDLGSYDSILGFVERATSLDRLDAVIQNAGIGGINGTINGVEITTHTNLLSPLFFAYAILPKLRESAKKTGLMGRFSFVGSDGMYVMNPKDFNSVHGSILQAMDDPAQQKGFLALGFGRYNLSKLLLFYAVRELAAQSPVSAESNVLINVETPGMTLSDFGEDRDKPWGGFAKTMKNVLMGWIARRTDVGARTLIHAVEPDLPREAHGQFLMDSDIVR
jgi:NAD(P)-dependent dehydrogenase (short-subunit alcohol dehydrogenase family)